MLQVDIGIVFQAPLDGYAGTVAPQDSAGKSGRAAAWSACLTLPRRAPNIRTRMSIGFLSVAIRRSPDRRFSRGISHDPYRTAVFDGLKARLDKLLRDHTSSDPRGYAAALREALVEAKVGLTAMQEALTASGTELESERKMLEDAERRGRLAAALPDTETVALAQRYAERHRTRVEVLIRKIAVQQDELVIARREIDDMSAQYRTAAGGRSSDSVEAAWRDLESAGATRPNSDDRLQHEVDQQRLQDAIEAQLAYLKKKMGRDHRDKA